MRNNKIIPDRGRFDSPPTLYFGEHNLNTEADKIIPIENMGIVNKYGHPINFWNDNLKLKDANFSRLKLVKQDNRNNVYIENHFYNQEPTFIAKVFQAIKDLFVRSEDKDDDDPKDL